MEIGLSSSYYRKSNRQLLYSSVLTVFFVVICLIFLTLFFSRVFLQRPLEQLREIVNSYASGDYRGGGTIRSYEEFEPLATVLEEMGNETGGDFLFAPTGEEVDALYKEVARLLGRGDEGYFKATYSATADEKDGTDRTIVVRYENAAGKVVYPAPRKLFWPLSKVIE